MRIIGEPLRTLLHSLMCHGIVQTILTCDLNMHRVAANFVSRLLTSNRKSTFCNLSRGSSVYPR